MWQNTANQVQADETAFPLQRAFPAGAAGAILGLLAGIALGAIVGPSGIVLGVGLGLGIGMIAGKALEKEERRRVVRTRELDAMIGITEGSIGAGSASLVPPPEDDEEALANRESWLSEWLTPPPPLAR